MILINNVKKKKKQSVLAFYNHLKNLFFVHASLKKLFLYFQGDITLRCNNVPLHLTETLLDHILSVLPESSKEHKLASALKTATGDLKEIVNSS